MAVGASARHYWGLQAYKTLAKNPGGIQSSAKTPPCDQTILLPATSEGIE
jgi:hypothetical protein